MSDKLYKKLLERSDELKLRKLNPLADCLTVKLVAEVYADMAEVVRLVFSARGEQT